MSIARAAAATTTVVGLMTSGSLGIASAQNTTDSKAWQATAASGTAGWAGPGTVAVPVGGSAAAAAGSGPCYPTRLVWLGVRTASSPLDLSCGFAVGGFNSGGSYVIGNAPDFGQIGMGPWVGIGAPSGPGFGLGAGMGFGPGLGFGAGAGLGAGLGPNLGFGSGLGFGAGFGPGYGFTPGLTIGLAPGFGPALPYGVGSGISLGLAPGYGIGFGAGAGFGYGPDGALRLGAGIGLGIGLGPGIGFGIGIGGYFDLRSPLGIPGVDWAAQARANALGARIAADWAAREAERARRALEAARTTQSATAEAVKQAA